MLRGHLAAFRYCCLVYVPSLALLPRISPTRKPPKDLILSLHVDSEHPFPAKPCLTARQRAMAAAQGEEARSGTLWECVSNLKASSEDLTPVQSP